MFSLGLNRIIKVTVTVKEDKTFQAPALMSLLQLFETSRQVVEVNLGVIWFDHVVVLRHVRQVRWNVRKIGQL